MQRYHSGEEVHLGDRILFGGSPGTVVFVIDSAEFSTEFPAEQWADYGSGFMLRTASTGLVMLEEPCEDLLLIHPAPPVAA